MVYSIGSNINFINYTEKNNLAPDDIDEERSANSHHKDHVAEVEILLKELGAFIQDEEKNKIYSTFEKFLTKLSSSSGLLRDLEIVEYLKQSVGLLKDRMHEKEIQLISCPYILYFVNKYIKIVFDRSGLGNPVARLDISFLKELKIIYEPYFIGTHFDKWKEVVINCIVARARTFFITSYELVEQVTNFMLIEVVFNNEDLDKVHFEEKLREVTRLVYMDFLKRLRGFEISYSFFYRVMNDMHGRQINEIDAKVIGSYFALDKITLGKVIQILIETEEKCNLSSQSWKILLGCLLQKIDRYEKILFLDAWHFITLFSHLKKKHEIGEDFQSKIIGLFEKEIVLKTSDKGSLNCLGLNENAVERLFNEMKEVFCLGDQLNSKAQKNNLVLLLTAVCLIHIPALKWEKTLNFLSMLAPLIQNSDRKSNDVLLMLVVELISQARIESPKNKILLICRLAQLNLFNHSHLPLLLRNWENLYKDFSVLCRDEYYLVECICPIFGINEAELVLHLYSLKGEVASFAAIKKKFVDKTYERFEPNQFEKECINRFYLDKNRSVSQQIDFLKFLICIYELPIDLEKTIVKKIIKEVVRPLETNLLLYADLEGNQFVQREVVEAPITTYSDIRDILKLLVHSRFEMSKEDFGNEFKELLESFLMHSFDLETVIEWEVLWNGSRTGITNSEYLFFVKKMMLSYKLETILEWPVLNNNKQAKAVYSEYISLVEKMMHLYGLKNPYILSKINLNWIEASQKLYVSLKKNAQALIKFLNLDLDALGDSFLDNHFTFKQNIQALAAVSYNNFLKLNSTKATVDANKMIRALNRPLFTHLLSGEPELVFADLLNKE